VNPTLNTVNSVSADSVMTSCDSTTSWWRHRDAMQRISRDESSTGRM